MRSHGGTILFLTILLFLTVLVTSGWSGDDVRADDPLYRTYEEIMTEYQRAAEDHPDIAEFIDLTERYGTPQTHGNRSLHALRISQRNPYPGDDHRSQRPAILLTSIYHAREWISVEVTTHIMQHLLREYGTDPMATYLVNNRDIWIIPFVNPDGYIQSWAQNDRDRNWTGWRKNIRDNNGNGRIDSGDGVDLNRNHAYMWGYDEQGSSDNPSSNTYRGPAPFSEPETQTVAALCNDTYFSVALHFHSYGNLILYPWAYDDLDTDDHGTFVMMGEQMSLFNEYQHGNTRDGIIYKCNGEACDWMYAEHRSFAFTVELGSHHDRFIPDESRILPICEENLDPTLFACYIADEPAAHITMAVPAPGSDRDDTWVPGGEGAPWSLSSGSVLGGVSWSVTIGDEPRTDAYLTLNSSLSADGGFQYLRFWEASDLSEGTVTGIYLRDGNGTLTEVTERISSPGGSERGHSPDGRGPDPPWVQSFYNLTPYLDEDPRWLDFMIRSDPANAGDVWRIDGVLISSSPPSDLSPSSGGDERGDGDFSITPSRYDLLLLPDVTEVLTLDITNDDSGNNTIEFSGESDRGWSHTITREGIEVSEVTLGAGESVTLNITIIIPPGLEAGESGSFTILFRSRDNTTSNRTLTISVDIDTFYHITLDDPGTVNMLPGQHRTVELTVRNLGNSQVTIDQRYETTSGNPEGWVLDLGDDPTVDAYATGRLFLSITAPAQIEKGREIGIRVRASVMGHASGNGVHSREFFAVIDEVNDAGFAPPGDTSIEPGKQTEFRVMLRNHGNVRQRFQISVTSEWEASLDREAVDLDPYASVMLPFFLTAPVQARVGETGSVQFRIDSPIQNVTVVDFTASAFYGITLTATMLDHVIPAGRQKELEMTVRNDGNTGNTILLSSAPMAGLSVAFSTTEVNLASGATTRVTLLVNLSGSKPYNQENSLMIMATSVEDPSRETGLTIRITVGKSYDIKLGITNEMRRQNVTPGENVDFIISLQNQGNSEAMVDLSVTQVPAGWLAVLDISQITIQSRRTELIRLSVTAPRGAGNNEEAQLTVTGTTGDASFGEVRAEVIATAVVSADEQERSISGMLVALVIIIVLIVAGLLLYLTRQAQNRNATDSWPGEADPGSGFGDAAAGEGPVSLDSMRTGTETARQNVTCPRCTAAFEVELPQGNRQTVKTMCVECGEIFAFERKPTGVRDDMSPPQPTPALTDTETARQNVTCPKCTAAFEVELPQGNRQTVKTMCVECGEIFAFERKPTGVRDDISSPQPTPALTETEAARQNVTCPRCTAAFEVELPQGNRQTVKTMCVECGEIFAFERKTDVGAEPLYKVQIGPGMDAGRETTLEPGSETESEAGQDRGPDHGRDRTTEAGQDRGPDHGRDRTTEAGQDTAMGSGSELRRVTGRERRPGAHGQKPGGPGTSPPEPGHEEEKGEVSQGISGTPETGVDIGGKVEQSSHMELPKVMKCPRCGRKVFLKGKEERIKCIFCGSRIQIERRRKPVK